jgi:hypothetical protein
LAELSTLFDVGLEESKVGSRRKATTAPGRRSSDRPAPRVELAAAHLESSKVHLRPQSCLVKESLEFDLVDAIFDDLGRNVG